MFYIVGLTLFLPFAVWITYTDLKKGIIHDKVILAGLAIGFLLAAANAAVNHSLLYVGDFFIGGIIGAFPIFLIILLTRGGMGAGDMKLMALVGAWFGYRTALLSLLLGVIVAGLTAVVLIVLKRKDRKSEIAFAPFIMVGLILVIVFRNPIADYIWFYYGIHL